MQTGAIASRVTTASHLKSSSLVKVANRIVVEDHRLRNFQSTALGGAWSAPSTPYSITSSVGSGDYIVKGATPWSLGWQDLGVAVPVTLPDGVTTDTPYLSSVALSGTQDLICFYANRFRNSVGSVGIYVIKCTDDGAGHLWWSQPITVCPSTAIADWNQESQSFVTFPRLQVINSEYWIVALACSREVNVITYHLVYFHSTDGDHWSRREVLVGVSNDADETAQGVNKYDTNTPFTLNDLKHAYLSVSGTNLYIISKTGATNFVCPATSRVGVNNPAVQQDITAQTVSYSYQHPTSPSTAQTTFVVQNPNNLFDNSSTLIPDAKIIHKDGLVTTNGQEVLTLSTSWVDMITTTKQMQQKAYSNALKVIAGDSMLHLRDFADDYTYEYNSPAQAVNDQFCDTSSFSVSAGRFSIGRDGVSGVLTAETLDPNDSTDEDLAYIHEIPRPDGAVRFKFKFGNAVNIAVTAAGVFQGDVEQADRSFYSVAYWVVAGKWVIAKATPTTTGRKIYTYQPIYYGSAESLSPDTWYWLEVKWYHNHVMALRSADGISFSTTVVDYTSPLTPASDVVPANLGFSGILGHSAASPEPAGNSTDASGGSQNMDQTYAVKCTMPATPGTLYAIAGLFSETGQPGDLNLMVVKDNGSGTAPADATVYNNVLHQVSVKALNYATTGSWVAQPIPSGVRFAANQILWVVVIPGSVGVGQSWEWFSDADGSHGTTMTSADNGATWSSVASKSMAAYLLVDVDGGITSFQSMYWTSGEETHTIEDLAHHIAAKAHVLNITPQTFIADTDLSGGWQPASKGVFGDFVLDTDVDATAGAAQVYFRATTRTDATTGYKLVVNNTMNLYWLNTLVYSAPSMQYVPTTYHLRVVCQTQWIYVWINEALALTFYAADATVPGYFGVGTATFTNLRIPEMKEIKPTWQIQAFESPLQNLSKLIDKTRYFFQMRYDDSLAIGAFDYDSSLDTYSATINETELQLTNRNAINQIQPTGNYWAERFAAKILDLVGWRRLKKYDYTDAFSNEDAYLAGKRQLLLAQQQSEPLTMNVPIANFAAENFDRITNSLDGNDYIIDSISIDASLKESKAVVRLGLRRWISGI